MLVRCVETRGQILSNQLLSDCMRCGGTGCENLCVTHDFAVEFVVRHDPVDDVPALERACVILRAAEHHFLRPCGTCAGGDPLDSSEERTGRDHAFGLAEACGLSGPNKVAGENKFHTCGQQ